MDPKSLSDQAVPPIAINHPGEQEGEEHVVEELLDKCGKRKMEGETIKKYTLFSFRMWGRVRWGGGGARCAHGPESVSG